MKHKLQDLIDIKQFQSLQDMMNEVYSFTTAILDLEGNILTASGWQDICTKFHRVNPESCKKCAISDSYILSHIHEANPGVRYKCMNGMYDYAFPIIIDGTHYGNFFTGQFFFEKPDVKFFIDQAKKYGFDEVEYLQALENVPVITEERLNSLTLFLKELIQIISSVGLRNIKQTEANSALIESQELYHDLVETAQDLIWQADADGRYTYLNPAWEDVFGYKIEEMIGKRFVDFQTKEWADRDLKEFERLLDGNTVKGLETVHLGKNGKEIRLIFNAKQVRDINGKISGTRGTAFDITERKQAEEALAQEKLFIEALLESLPGYLYVYDDQGNLIRWNKKHETMTGYSAEELSRMNISKWFEGDDAIRVAASIEEVMAKGYGEVEANLLIKGGGKLLVHSNGVRLNLNGKTYFTGVGIDITERKQAEKALIESEVFLKQTQEISKVGGWSYNLVTGESKLTDEIYKVYGLPIGSHFEPEEGMKFYHPDEREIISDAFSKIITDGKAYDLEVRFINAQGENRWVRTIGKPVFEGGNVVKINGILMDITDRKQAEDKLSESESKYTSLFASMNEGVALHEILYDQTNRAIDYRILDLNPAFEMQTGIQAEKARNQIASGFYGTAPAPYLDIYAKVAETGESTSFETYFPPLNKHFSISIFSPERGMFATVFTDITENKLNQERLEKSEVLFRTAFENSAVGMCLTATDGKFLKVNSKLCEMLGYSSQELLGTTFQEITHPDDIDKSNTSVAKAIDKQSDVFRFDKRYICKNGAVIWTEVSASLLRDHDGRSLYFITHIVDITERHRAVVALKNREDRLSAIIRVAPTGIGLVINRVLIEVNDVLCNMLGYSAEELIGNNSLLLYPDKAEYEYVGVHKYEQIKERGTGTLETRFKKKNGEIIDILMSSTPLDICDLKLGVAFTALDITERRKAQLEIQELNKDLEHRVTIRTQELADSNKELESFVYSVSHDLRAPLRSIMGFSEIISRRHFSSLNEEGKEYFGYVLAASKNMANLIEDLLRFSRLSKKSVDKETIEMNGIVEQVLQSLNEDILQSNAKIVVPADLPTVYADRSLLGQILSNLISNAIKYHRKGVDPEIIIDVDKNEETSIIKIIDNGQGIPNEHHEKIFNIFQRLHSSEEYPGTGIGLCIVKKAVTSLGGKIAVESELNKGSTFSVELPNSLL